jgi:hypothetical protein
MRLDEITSEKEKQQLDEILPVLAAGAGMLARGAAAAGSAALKGGAALARGAGSALSKGASAVGGALSKGASAVGGALAGEPASPTGVAAQAAAQQAEPQQSMGAIDIVNALKDPKIAMQMKAMKQKMPGGDLDAMVDPKGAADQQKQIQDLSTALDTLKKNAGIK